MLILIIFFLFSCNDKQIKKESVTKNEQKVPEFHIKVSYWQDCYWKVSFTNDNFDNEEDINNAFDVSESSHIGVVHQLDLFESETEAVVFARKLTSYKKCRMYNDSVKREYDRMIIYRKLHPIAIKKYESEESCKEEKGKEVIIY